MAFFDSEQSIFNSKPVELYHIFLDDTHYYFTSSDKSVFYNANKYVPQSITRKNISQSSVIQRSDLKFNITNKNPFFPETQIIYPKKSFKIELYRYQKDENEAILMFKGSLQSINFNNINSIELTFQNISESLRKNALRYSYQYSCNNIQYGDMCGLNIEDYTDTYIVSDIQEDNKKIFLSSNSLKNTDYYRSGLARDNKNQFRNIKEHTVTVDNEYIVLDSEFDDLKVGDEIKLSYGCKQSRDGCSIINNEENYFGFDYVPVNNPVDSPIY